VRAFPSITRVFANILNSPSSVTRQKTILSAALSNHLFATE
jgi:hypothetical protein